MCYNRPMRMIFIVIIVILVIVVSLFVYSRIEHPAIVPVNIEHSDLILVEYPKAGNKISSPLIVKGKARGTWYFEASFPIVIVDWDGKIIGEGHAEAIGDWMTEDFVPFKGVINYTRPENMKAGTYSERGAVIFKNDNPSGDPAKDKAVEVPVIFE